MSFYYVYDKGRYSREPRPSERAAILDKAADLLETKGWCVGTAWMKGNKEVYSAREADRFCAIGALEAVAPKWSDWAETDLGQQIRADYGFGFYGVADFNDKQKDKRKVIRAMRRTARNLRNRKGPFKP